MRLTRLGCHTSELTKLKGSLSELKKKVKAEKPKRGGLRVSHHLVERHVDELGGRLGSMRHRERLVHKREGRSKLGITTLMNCASTKGDDVRGTLARTKMLRSTVLFSALSAAAETLALSGARRVLLASAIKFVGGLPRRLMRTFGDALRRTGCTSVVIRMISTSGPRVSTRVRMICRALERLKTRKGPIVALFGGRSGIRGPIGRGSLRTSCSVTASTGAKRKLRRFGRTLLRVVHGRRVCVRHLCSFDRTNGVRLVHDGKRLLSRRCIPRKVRIGTCIPRSVCKELWVHPRFWYCKVEG